MRFLLYCNLIFQLEGFGEHAPPRKFGILEHQKRYLSHSGRHFVSHLDAFTAV